MIGDKDDKTFAKPICNMELNKPLEVASTVLLCFQTEAIGTTSIVFSKTRGQARAATMRAANDAGYCIKMTDIRCIRKSCFDGATEADRMPIVRNKCYMPDAMHT